MFAIKSLVLTFTVGSKLFTMQPFNNELHQINFIQHLLTTKGVYETMRHGKPWNKELVKGRNVAYSAGLKELLQKDYTYNPETFTICWIIYDENGNPVGRGGLQPEDSLEPIRTEPFVAILPKYQGQGIGNAYAKTIIDWFRANVNKNIPLRALAIATNEASNRALKTNKFKPYHREGEQSQASVTAWGLEYLVYERTE